MTSNGLNARLEATNRVSIINPALALKGMPPTASIKYEPVVPAVPSQDCRHERK